MDAIQAFIEDFDQTYFINGGKGPGAGRAVPSKEDLDALEPFLKEMGAEKPATVENHINVTPSSLPEHTAVHVLAPRGD